MPIEPKKPMIGRIKAELGEGKYQASIAVYPKNSNALKQKEASNQIHKNLRKHFEKEGHEIRFHEKSKKTLEKLLNKKHLYGNTGKKINLEDKEFIIEEINHQGKVTEEDAKKIPGYWVWKIKPIKIPKEWLE